MSTPLRELLSRVSNPPNPWHSTTVEWVGPAPEAELVVYEDRTKKVLAKNDSPDIPFTWSLNPYRGCIHACAYCYARPSHMHLDFGAGTDFERRIVVKPDAPQLLREAFERPSWKGEVVAFSGNTDCYQPLEASYGLTRACLAVCAAYHNPVGLITKSALVERDLDLLQRLVHDAHLTVTISIPFADPEVCRAIEPGAPAPARRFKTVRRLAEAGIPVGVNVAPIIPGLSDQDIPTLMERAAEAGAAWVGHTLLRLPGPVAAVFRRRLERLFPLKAAKVMAQIKACRGGRTNDPRFGKRMFGEGPRWLAIQRMIETSRARFGFAERPRPPEHTTFRRPRPPERQLSLGLG